MIIIIIIIILLILYFPKTETFSQEDEYRFAHFGGIPNMSQIWPYMVKYPKEYV